MNGNLYNVGVIVNTHGIRGDLKILSKTDFAEDRFAPGNQLYMVNEQTGEQLKVTVESFREQKGMYYIHLEGFNNINEVEKYKGWVLKITEEQQGELEDGEYFYHQIIDCEVVTDEGVVLGKITDILSPGANDVWVVKPYEKGKDILLPVIDPVILNVDIKQKKVLVHIIEGLI